MSSIAITIPGPPQGKASVRVTRAGRSYIPARSRAYMEHVRACGHIALRDHAALEDAPFSCEIEAVFSVPKSAKKRAGKPHFVKPDADNIAKAVLDGLVKSGVIPDDARCCELVIKKRYAIVGEDPCVFVIVESLLG